MLFNKKSNFNRSDALKNWNNHETVLQIESLNREIHITAITPRDAETLNRMIRFWNLIDEENEISVEERKPIKIFMDCMGGGSLTAAFTMIDIIKLSRTPIITINIGCVYKEAAYVYLAAPKRYSYPRASFMLKKGIKTFNAEDGIQSNYEHFCDLQTAEIKSMLAEKTKLVESDYDREIIWLTPEKAYEIKLCNEVIRGKII